MREILTLKEVNEFLESFKNNIFDLIICTDNIEQIIQQQKKDFRKTNIINPFLGHYVSLCYSYCVITLSKLFIDKEKRSLIKFLNKLENFDYDKELKQLLINNTEKFNSGIKGEYDYLLKNKIEIKTKIEEVKKIIKESETIVNKIKLRRDSFYAHFDPEKIKNIEVESLSEIQELTAIAQKIYDIFFGGIKNSTFLFVNFWSIDKVLEFNIEYYDRITKEIENLEK
jgi:uncharacterized protein (UPF0332 family)